MDQRFDRPEKGALSRAGNILHFATRVDQAADNDRLSNVVVRAEQPDLVANEDSRPTAIAATSLRDFEVLLLVLYAAYVLVVGATIVWLLRWGIISG